MLEDPTIREVAGLLAEASSALFITGAGLSAESGLPTYRGVGGLYEQRLTDDGVPIEVALSGPMFQRRPDLTWRYIGLLEAAICKATPSRAHRLLAAFERRLPRSLVLTQNVDGLHQAAGTQRLIEVHGNVHRLRCTACGHREVAPCPGERPVPPPCPRCERPLRPDVVLFEEPLPQAPMRQLAEELERGFDLVFVIGTTAAFPYISGPVIRAARQGVPTIEINPGETDVSHFVRYRFPHPAGLVLDALWSALPLGVRP